VLLLLLLLFFVCSNSSPNTVLVDIPENIQAEMVSLPTRARLLAAAAAAAPSGSNAARGATVPLQGHFTGALAPEPARFRAHAPTPISRTVMSEVCAGTALLHVCLHSVVSCSVQETVPSFGCHLCINMHQLSASVRPP
jgi:hypothetical protein